MQRRRDPIVSVPADGFGGGPAVGCAFDNVLIYGTGGLAFGGVEGRIVAPVAPPNDKATRFGVAVGGEYAFTGRISTKDEYLSTDLETRDLRFGGLRTTRDGVGRHFRLGVNHRF